ALWVLVIFFITGLYTGAFWVLFGAQVRQIIRTARGWRRFNLGMGLATAACVAMIWI
ncbi:MAG: LysE family translocator, partial [Aeromonas veronii]